MTAIARKNRLIALVDAGVITRDEMNEAIAKLGFSPAE